MTKAQMTFSDEELTAYLDGEVDPDLGAQIEAALSEDSQLSARLEALEVPMDALRAAFSLPELAAPQAPELRQPRRSLPWAMAASVVLALGVGALGGYGLRPQAPVVAEKPGWIAAVAAYQALYSTETLDGPGQGAARTQVVLAGFKADVGVDLAAATETDGLTFKRAQTLTFNGKPLMQMAYVDEQGRPFALCVLATAKDARAMKDQLAHGLAASSWVQNGVGYLVIGGSDPAATRAHAEDLQARLARG